MTTTRYWTVQQIIDQAAIELGLSAPGASVYSSTDANVILLRNLLNTAGNELALHEWPALTKEHTITVVNPGDTGEYTLPADFNGIIDDTGWDRSLDYPLGGPLSGGDWQYLQATGNSSTYVAYRILGDKFKTYPAPPSDGTVLAFEYKSRYWARATASASPDKAACTVSTDVVYLEPVMFVSLLKLRYREARGFDVTADLVSFERRFDAAQSAQIAASAINLAGQRV